MFYRASGLFVLLFGLALAGATWMNVTLINQARRALDEGILGKTSAASITRYHVALVIPDTRDSFFDGLTDGLLEAAPSYGVAVQIFRYHGNSSGEAETTFQLCLSSRLDGVIFYAGADGNLTGLLAQAAAANVVCVAVGTQAPRGVGPGFVGSSSLLQGLESGARIVRKLGPWARVGLLLSSDGSDPRTDPMYQGLEAGLGSSPGARIVQAARARPGILSGEEAASSLLRAEPSINVLVCANAPITEGAAQVVVDQGRVGQVLIVGTDESPTIDRLVDKGVILASIVRDSRRMGTEALGAFVGAKEGAPARRAMEVGFTVRVRQEPPK